MIGFRNLNELKNFLQIENSGMRAVNILFLNPNNNSTAQEQIVNNIQYIHGRSGSSIDFFLPGVENSPQNFLENFRNEFNIEEYIQIIEELEKISTWRYQGGTQLLIIPFVEGEFVFSKVLDLNLDRILALGNQIVIDTFFEALIQKFKEAGRDEESKFIDTTHRYVLESTGWKLLESFITNDVMGLLKGILKVAIIKETFKFKSYIKSFSDYVKVDKLKK
ncbi:Uncharacterised protein [Acholeplasma oculi]|uniref:Uncharacterized protein n=1 Tax=Acholeplasma oculi TaxID=35623 RepID=A0A061AAU1_9MOLU|nr:hypothetical protein [Acholeplasma oculi]CDR30514.1 hypothetical protein Aocu_04410 [Acholeplasma oculi]SKC47730.1 hypothetical protein SAMN02745122_1311 [Acholeplasma oculi]SUT89161.1 Uncharacterised protein [Acholeplasma oculi]